MDEYDGANFGNSVVFVMDAARCLDFCQSPWWAIIVNIFRFTDKLREPVEARNALCLITVASNGRRRAFVATFERLEVCRMGTILIILLVLLLIGAVPSWPYSRSWGYYPSGLLGLVLLVVIILALVGRV